MDSTSLACRRKERKDKTLARVANRAARAYVPCRRRVAAGLMRAAAAAFTRFIVPLFSPMWFVVLEDGRRNAASALPGLRAPA